MRWFGLSFFFAICGLVLCGWVGGLELGVTALVGDGVEMSTLDRVQSISRCEMARTRGMLSYVCALLPCV